MDNKHIWHLAAKNGLILAATTIAFDTLSFLFPSIYSIGWLTVLLSLLKTTICVTLVYKFMSSLTKSRENIRYGESFSYGMRISLLSSVLSASVATFIFVNVGDSMETFTELMMTSIPSVGVELDYETFSKIIPISYFLGQFFRYIICGLIITAIIANYTKKVNPFTEEN